MYRPKIVPFVCDWCSLQSADFIGLTRLFFPKKVSFIRVPCSGRVNPEIVLFSFKNGADGVIVMGCEKGSCNYRTGNFQAERWSDALRMTLELSGLNKDRFKLHLEMDTEIISVYEKFYDEISNLGPIGNELGLDKEKDWEKIKNKFEIIELTLLDNDIKWLIGREWTLVTIENVYGEKFDEEKFKMIAKERIRQQFIASEIMFLTREKPMSIAELSKILNRNPKEIFDVLTEMQRKERITLYDFVDRIPRYISVR
uniref:Hydrogenase iron-sulfur subunit n=1 Tax=candidate division WOR-3 bacterium TaxID=2052148 RepID=A0A7C4YH20_UNCW3